MYKTFTLPLKSAIFSLSALFILAACGGLTIDLNLPTDKNDCLANPFHAECDGETNIGTWRATVIKNCEANPNNADSEICIAADNWVDPSRDNENGAGEEVVDTTPKDTVIKSEFDTDSFTKPDNEKIGIAGLEIVDLCTNPATSHDKQCTHTVIYCINNPFSSICQSDDVLGNFVRGGVTLSKAVVLQDKRARDCRDGVIDNSQCQTLNSEKQRCTGAAFSDASCSAVTYSVCKADAFDPLCGEKENFGGVYFNERSYVCEKDPNNPNCTGTGGHIAVVCNEYPFDRLCTGNTNYDGARAKACEVNPTISLSCSTIQIADVCLDNPFGPTCADSDYNNARKELVKTCAIQAVTGAVTTACNTIIEQVGSCFIDPFSTACDGNHHAVKNYIGLLRSSRVALCESNLGGLESWIAPLCASVPDTTPVGITTTVAPVVPATPQVTASVWADSFDEPLSRTPSLDDTESKFLIARETDLDTGELVPYTWIYTSDTDFNDSFTFAKATFNGVALGGDAADGLAFVIVDNLYYSYIGLLSGTNLGAPLTDTIGSAKWIGSFKIEHRDAVDFVLNVSFGTGDGAGEVEAAIIRDSSYDFYDYYIAGEFDDTGVITGTARQERVSNRTRESTNRGTAYNTGKLTGLIGEEGAVGAFLISNTSGGFVARPSSYTELQGVLRTCAADPFNKLCAIGYESERNAIIEHCIIGGNANDAARCDSANEWHFCINNPFGSDCDDYLPQHYQQAQANRVAFCRTEGNTDHDLCTVPATYQNICTNHPFDTQCLGNNDYNQARASACIANPDQSRCRYTVERVCNGNPFDRLCRNTQTYLNTRVSICRGNPLDGRCGWTISTICNSNPFDTLCPESGWNNARETACRNGSASTRQCGGIITGVCGNNPFDTLCGNGYTNARESACRNGSTSSQCGGIISGICSGNPFDTLCGSGYTQSRRSLCTDDPFATRCAGEGYNDLRVTFCENNAGTHPSCPAPEPTTPQVTAKVWADSFDTPLAHAASRDDTEGKFLIGKETDLDEGRLGFLTGSHHHSAHTLSLADATFNGVALGGDRADGVAYFAATANRNGLYHSYAGVLLGTNLGAPLTDTIGSAKWVGSFKVGGTIPADFILNISFGTGDGAGEIEALIQKYYTYRIYDFDYHIAGEFDDAGVITGTARRDSYRTNDPNNKGSIYDTTGELTGLIGEEGAVGTFFVSETGGAGGFVARPSSAAELRNVEQTCADDPFHKFCTIGYESERIARLDHCITGGNADDASCRSAKKWQPCIKNPFKANCDEHFAQHYQQARINRVAFCRTSRNAGNALCTVDATFTHICTNHPFDAQCRGNNNYRPIRRDACLGNPFAPRCAGNVYNDLRVTFCQNNAGNSACPRPVVPTTDRVTTAALLATFDNELPSSANPNDSAGARLLESTENSFDTGGIEAKIFTRRPEFGARIHNLNFDTGTFNGRYLNGDAEDGMAFFTGYNEGGKTIGYVGILSGTDLGAPVNQTGTATWNGQIANTIWGGKPVDFRLNINFDGQGQGGSIEGFYQVYKTRAGLYGYIDLVGRFDAGGIISGTTKIGHFESHNRDSLVEYKKQTGVLTGLIGEEGAVGAFIFERNASAVGWVGGFVARPSAAFATPETLVNNGQVTTIDWLTSFKQESYSIRKRLLEASKTGLSIANHHGADYQVLTLADSTFDGRDLGGDAADGVAFSRGDNERDWYGQYIGILSGTDLGAPLTQRQGTVYWEGKIIAIGNSELFTDFTLQINFGQGDQVGTISAFVEAEYPDLGHHYRLDGSFDTNGVIKGTTESGMFTTQNARIPQYWRRSGTLTGLIGEEGAVGAFFSNRGGGSGYTGGFVAKPNVTPATIPTPVAQAPVDRVTKDVWLNALDKEEISPDTPYIDARVDFSTGLNINGEANNGFFFKRRFDGFSEIFSGTDLGAPLAQTTGSLRWNGLFVSGAFGWRPDLFQSDFVLEITLGGPDGYAGRIDAAFKGEIDVHEIYLRGVFDDNGVISGRVFYGSNFVNSRDAATGHRAFQILTGLIGQNGAVGVIDSTLGHSSAGFIASPKAINVVHYADWQVPHLGNRPTSAAYNQFIASTQGGLNIGNLKNANGTRVSVNTLNFNSADNIDGGVAFARGFISENKGFFATVLDTTNLGEPVTLTTGSAIWQGKFKALIGDRTVDKNLDLTVDFGNDTISAGVHDTGNYYLSINGRYNENGFIDGTTSYGTASVNSDGSRNLPGRSGNVGTLKGLIGQEGAVGAFISKDNAATRSSKNTIGYAGGFVATPPSQ